MSRRDAVLAFLRGERLVGAGERPTMARLSGGVSSELWKVDLARGPVCVKRALGRLNVERPWFAPVSRSHVEYLWLTFAAPLRPGQVPRVLAHDRRDGLLAMEYLAPERYPVWKELLLAGEIDVADAHAVGDLVGALHAASTTDCSSAERFATDEQFDALRIGPYLRATARAHPDLRERLMHLAAVTASTHVAVAHGDVSPKNVLIGPDGPVLLDAECAWFGDPAFDVAFCINHLLLKSVKAPSRCADLRAAARAFTEAQAQHISWEEPVAFHARVVGLLPALSLARVDGDSPVDYLDRSQRAAVRTAGRDLLLHPAADLEETYERWTVTAGRFRPAAASDGQRPSRDEPGGRRRAAPHQQLPT